jgi:hypothetical protein
MLYSSCRNPLPLLQISRKNNKKKGMESHRQIERETNIRPWLATANGIRDQGAGGNCNVVKEIIYPKGAEIDIREFDWKKEEEI